MSWPPLSTPTRFRPAEAGLYGALARARDELSIVVLWALAHVIEIVVFGGGTGILRQALAFAYRGHIAAIRPAFDTSFYVKQFAHKTRRRRVFRNALLHYVILGWREGRAPSWAFDPYYFLRRHPSSPRNIDPLLLHARRGDVLGRSHELIEPAGVTAGRRGGSAVLTINHARGGGSATYLDLYEGHLHRFGYDVLRLRAVPGGPRLGALHGPNRENIEVIDLASELPRLAEHCRRYRVSKILVNHVIDRPSEIFEWIPALGHMIGGGYEVLLHDYYALCPRVNMVTGEGRFCDAAAPTVCASCTGDCGSDVRDFDAYEWRPRFAQFLDRASCIIVPSRDTADRLARYFPSRLPTVWEPECDEGLPVEQLPVLKREDALRVVCVGALSVPKGAHILQSLAAQALAQGAPFRFGLIGDSPNAKALKRVGVHVTGFYKDEDLGRLLGESQPHVVFLPSIWPETWSFVLSAGLRQGLPIIAFDIGAPAERLRRLSRGHLLPTELASTPEGLLCAFRELRSRWIVA